MVAISPPQRKRSALLLLAEMRQPLGGINPKGLLCSRPVCMERQIGWLLGRIAKECGGVANPHSLIEKPSYRTVDIFASLDPGGPPGTSSREWPPIRPKGGVPGSHELKDGRYHHNGSESVAVAASERPCDSFSSSSGVQKRIPELPQGQLIDEVIATEMRRIVMELWIRRSPLLR